MANLTSCGSRYDIATHRKACNLNNNNIKTKQKDYEKDYDDDDDGSNAADRLHGACAYG